MPGPASRRLPMVRRLMLSDFRSYPTLDLSMSGRLVAFIGENGAGKTNLLEAISLFTPGRGLRRVDLSEMIAQDGAGGPRTPRRRLRGRRDHGGDDLLRLREAEAVV